MANNTLLASDNFASGSLAAGWAAISGLLVCKVVGSGASAVTEPNTINVSAGQIWTGLTWPNDQGSEVTIGAGWVNLTNGPILQLPVRYATGAQTGYIASMQGHLAGACTATIFSVTAGVATQLATVASLTIAAGDIWSFQAYGPCLVIYQNYKRVLFWADTTYTAGSPGFLLNSPTLADCQVSAWRGYNSVQQDGIWAKQGTLAGLAPVASDINTGVSFVNSGLDSASQILHEGNAQILSGTVYKMLIGTASGIQYAESLDGLTWSRYGSTVLAGFSFPQVFKSGSTYYLFVQSNTVAAGTANIASYTSSDCLTWSSLNSNVIALGAGGTWDHLAIYLFSPVGIISGTWYALYSGVNAGGAFAMGLATSADGNTWSKYGSNPVAASVWASTPYLINGVYYLWGAGVPPGQVSSGQDPTVGLRVQSTDLINWTNRTVSIQHSQFCEGVNATTGFAYPTALITVGNNTYMYLESGPSNTASNTGTTWNLGLATVPATMSSIIQFPENAISQVASDIFTNTPPNLSGNWTTPSWASAAKIVAGPFVEPTATSTICAALYTGASFGNDQSSSIAVAQLSAGTDIITLSVRGSTSARTQYEAVLVGGTGSLQTTSSYIARVVAGSATQLTPFASITIQTNDIWTLQAVGNAISLFQNGFLILQCEDTSASAIASGSPGFWLFSSAGIAQARINAWSGGNANVLPAYVTSVADSMMMMGVGS